MTFPPPPRRPYSEAEGGGAARRPRRLATVALAVVAGAAFVAGRVTASERLIPPPWGGGGCNFLEAERSRPAVAPGAAPALRLRRPAGRRRAQRGEGTGGPRQMGTVVARRIPGERADGATLHEYFEALGNHFKNDTRVGFDPEGGARGDSVAERGIGRRLDRPESAWPPEPDAGTVHHGFGSQAKAHEECAGRHRSQSAHKKRAEASK